VDFSQHSESTLEGIKAILFSEKGAIIGGLLLLFIILVNLTHDKTTD